MPQSGSASRVICLMAMVALLVSAPASTAFGQTVTWVTFQCTERLNALCDIVFYAKQAESDDLRGHCPQHDPSAFLGAFTGILIVARPQSSIFPYRLGRDLFPTHFENRGITLTPADSAPKKPSWGDPTLTIQYPCYTAKLRDPQETRVGLVASKESPAVILIPFPKTTGKARLLVPFYRVTGGPLISLRQYVKVEFDLELK